MMKVPRVGVGVLVFRDNKILLGKRKNSHGVGTWSPLGGHLEFGESPEECARREVLEEADIEIKNLKRGPFSNDIFASEDKHYVTLFILADYCSGTVKLQEPDKCEGWEWFEENDLPQPLFLPFQNLMDLGFNFNSRSISSLSGMP